MNNIILRDIDFIAIGPIYLTTNPEKWGLDSYQNRFKHAKIN